MSYEVFTLLLFDRAVHRLKKKYPRIRSDLERLIAGLRSEPFSGFAIPGYDRRLWKIRMASVDMQSGERGGYRVIYSVHQELQRCFLLYVYAKPEKEDVSSQELEVLLLELEAFLDSKV